STQNCHAYVAQREAQALAEFQPQVVLWVSTWERFNLVVDGRVLATGTRACGSPARRAGRESDVRLEVRRSERTAGSVRASPRGRFRPRRPRENTLSEGSALSGRGRRVGAAAAGRRALRCRGLGVARPSDAPTDPRGRLSRLTRAR